jgi:glycosyltransferase involved in cell wall biosynthesis
MRSDMSGRAVKPMISIIIPTYNGGKYICQTIESALNQTFTDVEILVIDDGSDESLSELLAQYSGRIQYIYKERSGPAASRNLGIKLSRGAYLAFLDHDDLWHPDKLKIQAGIMADNPQCALVYSYPVLIDAEGKKIPNEGPSHFPSGSVVLDFLLKNRITTFSAVLVRKSVFDLTGLLDESPEVMTCDDYDMWLRISDVSEVIFAQGDLVYYRIHSGNLVKSYDQNLRAHMCILEKFLKSSVRLKQLPATLVRAIVRENRYEKYCYFAFIYFYRQGGERQARKLFLEALRLKPYMLSLAAYLSICYLPTGFRNFSRKIKCLFLPQSMAKNTVVE